MNILEVKNISKTFGLESVLKDVSLIVEKDKTLSLLGASGSGKSTLLKIIAGLEKQDKGNLYLNELEVSNVKPQERQCVYLYQESLLFPHLNVFENIAFGLRIKKEKEDIIQQKVNSIIELIDLKSQSLKMTNQLSGGQKQRISFARAIVIEPKILLLDEPFGALDSVTRKQMQVLFKDLVHQMNVSSIFVTHDIKEAIIMGDALGKIENGILKQYSSPTDFIKDKNSGVQEEINFWQQYNL
jgi:putrescine transport system ATP-binding protein